MKIRCDSRGNASSYRGCLMVVECTINVGFHSSFSTFKQRGHSLEGFSIAFPIRSLDLIIHSLDPTRLAIINGLSFNPTYDSNSPKWSSIYSPRERRKALLLRGHKENRDLEKIAIHSVDPTTLKRCHDFLARRLLNGVRTGTKLVASNRIRPKRTIQSCALASPM